jgi:hypothetical protein
MMCVLIEEQLPIQAEKARLKNSPVVYLHVVHARNDAL